MKRFCAIICITSLLLFAACAEGGGSNSVADGVPNGYVKENGSLMFDEPSENYAIYNYCPSVIEADENTRYVYYCTNKTNTNVKDYVGFRKGIKIDGEWYWSQKSFVLEPTLDSWDSMHTCDPDVIKGEFQYDGESYSYLMTYLGCVTTDNQCNEVGLAVSKAPEGPFIKCDKINPIVSFEYNPDRPDVFQWGYGQSSLVSVDKKGKVLLFYTQGTVSENGTRVERWDFSDLNNPVREFSQKMAIKGIMTTTGAQAHALSNADFVYDEAKGRIYAVGDGFPFSNDAEPSFVASSSYVGFIADLNGEGSQIGDVFNNYDGRYWNNIGFIDHSISGYYRNHNCCMVSDVYGHTNGKVEAAYTVSELNKPSSSLWTYRIHRYVFPV